MSRALWILAQGREWVVVAKPAGMVVHRSPWAPRAPAVLQVLRDQLGRHVYPVHRLDSPVSGCLLMATDAEVAGVLSAALQAPDARKRYLAFVRGNARIEGDVRVETPMKDDQGIEREAASVVRKLGGGPEPRCSLFEVEPLTGRFHQVRRHVRDLGHPVLGDGDHGDNKENRAWKERGLRRLGLHCLSLSLEAPEGGRIEVSCPVPTDLRSVWETLPWWPEVVAARPEMVAAMPEPPAPEGEAGEAGPTERAEGPG